jgi:PEP-CTERM motif
MIFCMPYPARSLTAVLVTTVTATNLTWAVALDGSLDADGYGTAVAVQTVQTGFGDNKSELDAAYARVQGDRLFLMFTGNLESVWNRLDVFIDSVPGGMNQVTRPASVFDRLTFDAGFAPDFLIENIAGPSNFIFQFAEFGSDITTGRDTFVDVFDGQAEGTAQTATGVNLGFSFGLGFDNSNTAGVTGGSDAADQAAAAAVTTGIELAIPLAAIGNPSGPFKVLAMVNGAGGNFLSNQLLGGLEPPQANLGSDGQGNLYATLGLLDLNDFAGDQYFIVDPTAIFGDLDGDGFVGIGDLGMVLSNWNQSVTPDNWLTGDPSGDGFVGIEDLNTVLGNWNAGTPPSTGGTVPEPASLVLVGLGAGALMRRSRPV